MPAAPQMPLPGTRQLTCTNYFAGRPDQWAYPAGIDWFVNLADANAPDTSNILRSAYRDPLMPNELTALWPIGPTIGGNGLG